MKLDDEVCLCFHVSKRKVVNYIRIEQPRRASQLSQCYGAGTGCGWCRRYLKRLFEKATTSPASFEDSLTRIDQSDDEPSAQEYAQSRSEYVKQGGGTPPPGATPV